MHDFILALIATGIAWLFIKGGEATAAGWREGRQLHRADDHPDWSPRRKKWNERWHAAGYTANQMKTGLPDARHALVTGWRRSGSEREARRVEFDDRARRADDRAKDRATGTGRTVPGADGSDDRNRATEPSRRANPAERTEPTKPSTSDASEPSQPATKPTPIRLAPPPNDSTAESNPQPITPVHPPRSIHPSTNTGTTAGGPMSMPTGEVTNYEGHIAQYNRLIQIYQNRVEAAEATIRELTGATAALDNLDSGSREVHMDARHLGFIATQMEANNADLESAKAARVSANENLQAALAMRKDLESRAGQVNQVTQATGHTADARYHQPV